MEKREWAILQLQEKQKELGRPPHKDDFEEPTMARIKGILGPWPRALEAAGLKAPRVQVKKPKGSKRSGRQKDHRSQKDES